jgi:hypothetical protein
VFLAAVAIPGFAFGMWFMLGCKVTKEGLRPFTGEFYALVRGTAVLPWEDIRTVYAVPPLYCVRNRDRFGMQCFLPGRLLLKDPSQLKALVERHAPADNILRKKIKA